MRDAVSSNISTRFLIISNTHNFELDNNNLSRPFRQPTPKTDVILPCGDLTQCGGSSAYKKASQMLGAIEAELKLVVAGKYDLSMDSEYWKSHRDDSDDPKEYSHAMKIWTGQFADEAGVTYLTEGTYAFTLHSGATFAMYASPYTPEFGDCAFPYKNNEDRFNSPSQVAEGITSVARSPISDFPNIEIGDPWLTERHSGRVFGRP